MDDGDNSPRINRRELLLTTAGLAVPALLSAGAAAADANRSTIMTSRFDLDRFIDDCRQANEERDDQAAVREVIARAMEDTDQVMSAVGEPASAGIKPLYRSDDLTILNIVWSPFMQLMPHDHKMWALLGIYTGREDNILWRRTQDSITAREAVSLTRGDAAGLPDDVIHSVINPIGKFTGAIHVYGGDFFATPRSEWDPGTLEESPWELEKAIKVFEESNARFRAWEDATLDGTGQR